MKSHFKPPGHGTTFADRLSELTRFSEIKRIAYALSALQKQKGFRSLAVLSAYPGEGKTLLCAALAIAYAEACQSKVLVVDATTRHNPKSLILREGLDATFPSVEYVSLRELRHPSNGDDAELKARETVARGILMESSVVSSATVVVPTAWESDQALIRKGTQDGSGRYGLILLDTVALTAQNKSNIDPFLVAHLSDASLVVVSRKLLNARDSQACARMLMDPTLHLIGMVSNEEFIP